MEHARVDGREPELVAAIGRLMRGLVVAREPYMLTNESLIVLVDEFTRRLVSHAQRGETVAVLRHWEEHLDSAREEMLRLAREDVVTLKDGNPLGLFSESKARVLASFCPDDPEF